MSGTPAFNRYLGIDYSGAQTPTSSLKGLRVYQADRAFGPREILPPPSLRKYWTRRGLAEWLRQTLLEGPPTLVGIDHAFSFPLAYFEKHRLPLDWSALLDDFHAHWPTDENLYVSIIREGALGNAAARSGSARWRRLTELRAGGAKSVFHFDVQGQVATSTHAGLPWLRFLRRMLGERVHFWPFDGWVVPARRSVIAEVYPRLWSQGFPRETRDGDQHDAYSVAARLRGADEDASLEALFAPELTSRERGVAEIEGWILGVG